MTVLDVKDLSFHYGDKTVLDHVSFSLDKGDIVGLIGNNGAGKTTLMKVVSGILPSHGGTVDLKTESVGALIEEPALYPYMSVIENLYFYCRLYGRSYDVLDEFKDALGVSTYLNNRVSRLSLGMRQRVGLFIALIASNEFILLDEPTNGLDPTGIEDLLQLIKRLAKDYGLTFIISSHILQNLEQICNKNFLLRNGHLQQLDDEDHMRYTISSFDVSPKDLVEILKKHNLSYEQKDADIIVGNLAVVEEVFKTEGVTIQSKRLGLSEVFFHAE